MSNLWLDMFTAGLHKNRPATPPAGLSTALYFETDTSQLFHWSGNAWTQVATSLVPASVNALGPVRPDGTSINIDVAGVLSIASPYKGTYCFPGAVSQYTSSGQLFATQGNQFTPLVNMTIDQVIASWYGAGTVAHRYVCSVVALNSIAGRQITTQLGVVTVLGTGGTQDLTYNFSPALTLVAGTSYAIVITDLDAATTTTSCSVGGIAASGGIYPLYGPIPMANSANDQRIVLAKNTFPGGGDTFTSVGGTAAIGIRAQF